MTLDEAIHIQQLHLDGDPALKDIKLRKGMHLSIEAMKRCKVLAANDTYWAARPLPGETLE